MVNITKQCLHLIVLNGSFKCRAVPQVLSELASRPNQTSGGTQVVWRREPRRGIVRLRFSSIHSSAQKAPVSEVVLFMRRKPSKFQLLGKKKKKGKKGVCNIAAAPVLSHSLSFWQRKHRSCLFFLITVACKIS